MLEQFLKNSELVSNLNHVCGKDELKDVLSGTEYQFVDTAQAGFEKVRCGITKAGFPAALIEADFAIAETGSVVIESSDEQKRLATCLAEDLHVIVPLSKVKESLTDIAGFMREKTSDASSSDFPMAANRDSPCGLRPWASTQTG